VVALSEGTASSADLPPPPPPPPPTPVIFTVILLDPWLLFQFLNPTHNR
jgi:hypothetical protein